MLGPLGDGRWRSMVGHIYCRHSSTISNPITTNHSGPRGEKKREKKKYPPWASHMYTRVLCCKKRKPQGPLSNSKVSHAPTTVLCCANAVFWRHSLSPTNGETGRVTAGGIGGQKGKPSRYGRVTKKIASPIHHPPSSRRRHSCASMIVYLEKCRVKAKRTL